MSTMERTAQASRLSLVLPVTDGSYPRTEIRLGAKWDNHFQASGCRM